MGLLTSVCLCVQDMKISYNLIGTRLYLLAKLAPFSNAQFEFLPNEQAET